MINYTERIKQSELADRKVFLAVTTHSRLQSASKLRTSRPVDRYTCNNFHIFELLACCMLHVPYKRTLFPFEYDLNFVQQHSQVTLYTKKCRIFSRNENTRIHYTYTRAHTHARLQPPRADGHNRTKAVVYIQMNTH